MKLKLTKKQAKIFNFILANAETNIVTREELESIDRKAILMIESLREYSNDLIKFQSTHPRGVRLTKGGQKQ
jgi:hypothetical protein